MNSTVSTLIQQTLMMFILAGIGYWLFKIKKITAEGSKTLGNILIYIVLPAVIVKSFIVERTPEKIQALLLATLLGVVALALAMLISALIFKKDPIANFASAFSNVGFFGIPLITGTLGAEAVFFLAPSIALLNLGQFSYGVAIMTGEKGSLSFKKVMTAPFMIAIIIGLILFFTQLPLPGIVTNAMTYLANVNTPLAMLTVGVYLAQTDLGAMFKKPQLYWLTVVRLLLIPLATLAVFCLVPAQFHDMKLAILIGMICPVGSNVAVYAQLHGKDFRYAVETVIISTIFSILTMPLVVYLAEMIWK